MGSVRVDVQWSPAAPDQFLTWGTDLQLYQVQDAVPSEAIQPPRVRLNSHSVASLLATNNDIQYIKCVSWCPAVENDPTHQLLAVGQANGKVAITNFSKLTDPRGIKGKEFNPKHARPVNSLAWSSQEPQLLAAGLDKVRTDHSVVVCDVTRPGVAPSYSFEQRNSISGDVLKPWMEYGNAETAHSVAFSLHTARTLMAGMNNKQIRSEERSRALELCSWGFENESLLGSFLAQLEAAGSHTRAAAAAVFNQRIKEAVQILQRGYTEERKALWRETCISLRSQLTDPYLRAMFAFLTDDADSFDPVLGEAEMAIQDRVAFACTYLSDVRLMDFLEKLNTRLTEEGNLDGILLTGLCSEGIDLLQRYVDLTGDVQTVALVTIHTLQHAIAKDSRLAHWVQRNLLDSLCLWNERAQLDVIMNENKHAERPPQHIYITCNFCKKGITPYIQAAGRPRNPYARFGTGSSNKSKIHDAILYHTQMQACPNCRKPLPRCSLCLVHMGTPSGWDSSTQKTSVQEDTGEGPASASTSRRKLSHFSSWFTWCQTCRHGGHAHHLMEWFK
ncbi:WD repeat-containing protein mio-A [Portunus trituberculatus]|uniref:WD repeat-containing protein mio-A n=1 Tax=Portunus trituberculatus TaxID=210409 RepID=A0A5B7EM90_PORTR|nr:WD repeat-containing protein mio-A [Portunus trituberculatus]